jgi:hypothetical protein
MVKKQRVENSESLSSAGHRLGQIVGDWWETKVIYPLLEEVAQSLGLYLDNRIVSRTCRADKVQWADVEGNYVDYDYVLELGGNSSTKGVPVAFLESFWRRGARHSKDKARDDTNKLLPMRETYSTARFLAIAACGEFTEPAREYVRSRNVELFYIGKEKIVEAFQTIDATIDYPDSLPEKEKMKLVKNLESKFSNSNQIKAATNLRNIAGQGAFTSFKQRIYGSLTATPQEIRIYSLARSGPVVFDSIKKAADYLDGNNQKFPVYSEITQYEYEVTFSDGSEFARALSSLDEVKVVNTQLFELVQHFDQIAVRKPI